MKFFKSKKENSFLLLLGLLLVLIINNKLLGQQIIYVDANGNGNGSSWGNAYSTLTAALQDPTLTAGDQIWVAHGTYYPGTIGRGSSFQIKDGVAVYGGFQNGQTDTTQRFDYGHGGTYETILSGDGGVIGNNTDNFYHVVTFDNGAQKSTILNGFTIMDGNADNTAPSSLGAGIYNEGSPVIENCTIIDNYAVSDGAGIANLASNTNYGDRNPIFTDCIISGNSSSGGTGGLLNVAYDASCFPKFINCIISGNSGGAIRDQGDNTGSCAPTFMNCTITGNAITEITNSGANDNPIIKNSIIWNNYGSSVYNFNNAAPTYFYSIVAGSGGSSSWNTSYGTDGGSNIDQDPLFNTPIDPTTDPPTINGDFHLQIYSPALSAGSPPSDVGVPTIDLEGRSRPLPAGDSHVDMGVYEEYTDGTLPVELTTFSASVNGQAVVLNWNAATEVNNFGFNVERLSKSFNSS